LIRSVLLFAILIGLGCGIVASAAAATVPPWLSLAANERLASAASSTPAVSPANSQRLTQLEGQPSESSTNDTAVPLTRALIVLVQSRLAEFGFDPGPADGISGPRTRAAIEAFRASHGLAAGKGITTVLLNDLGISQRRPSTAQVEQPQRPESVGPIGTPPLGLEVASPPSYSPAPYVAFSLKTARDRIAAAGAGFRSTDGEVFWLSGINRVQGFVYDSETEDLILVGAREAGRAPLSLDDLVVALRARLVNGAWPLVSIDPLPNGKRQRVRFEGGIEDTAFGQSLFEADYRLKEMVMGLVDSGVVGVRSVWDRKTTKSTSGAESKIASRFWFYPTTPQVVVREGVSVIRGLQVAVFTEVLSATIAGSEMEDLHDFHDPVTDAFAAEVSTHFEALAVVHPSFNRLRGLQELVGLSVASEQLGSRPDLSWWLNDYPLPEVVTPREIDLVRREHQDARSLYILEGGVQLAAMAIRLEAGDVGALKEAVLKVRPSPDRLNWSFVVGEWVIPLEPGQLRPDQILPLFEQARFLQVQKRHEDAVAVYDAMLTLDPELAPAWNNRGVALAELDRLEESLESHEKALALAPNDAIAWAHRGGVLGRLGRFAEAVESFSKALVLNPRLATAWTNRGVALARLGRLEEALEDHDTAIRLESQYAFAWMNRGIELANLDRLPEALESLDKALALDPKLARAWTTRGTVAAELGRIKGALISANEALALEPTDTTTWAIRGTVLQTLGRLLGALESYDRALALDSNLAGVWHNRGVALAMLGRFEEALESLDKALALDPKLAQAWTNRGAVLDKLFHFSEALECHDRALALNPNLAAAWVNRGVTLGHLHHRQEELASYDNALALDPKLAMAWYNLGFTLYQEQHFVDARAALERAATLGSQQAEAFLRRETPMRH
jgi:tetratricopeptide (TPR) repeat protein/peptidoglycan hydrolase-like protein with peptidoglycan-binding domain